MSEIERGFWQGLALLCVSSFLAGIFVARDMYLPLLPILAAAIPGVIVGLHHNRQSALLDKYIETMEKWSLR